MFKNISSSAVSDPSHSTSSAHHHHHISVTTVLTMTHHPNNGCSMVVLTTEEQVKVYREIDGLQSVTVELKRTPTVELKKYSEKNTIKKFLGDMELLPILSPEDEPQENQWYCLVPTGTGPGVSVGHTCTYISSRSGGKGKIVIVGGANPNGSFSESYIINLDRHEWEFPDWEGLQARYEHCSFTPESDPESLWVFAGAEQSGNRNCVQVLRTTDSGPWKTVDIKGTPPKPRTYHTNTACVGDRLLVFSGGDAGATPVTDLQVHIFDTVTSTWSQPDLKEKPPSPRHGHVVVAVGPKIYIHGGMAGEKFHMDMFSLDTENMKWERIKAKGDVPPGTAAHSAVALGKNIYIFGGMTAEGATNSMYKFQSDKLRWTLMKFEGDLPPNRLDHSMCAVPWSGSTEANQEEKAQSCEREIKHLCFVFGGMDTQGVIFNDCLVTVIT